MAQTDQGPARPGRGFRPAARAPRAANASQPGRSGTPSVAGHMRCATKCTISQKAAAAGSRRAPGAAPGARSPGLRRGPGGAPRDPAIAAFRQSPADVERAARHPPRGPRAGRRSAAESRGDSWAGDPRYIRRLARTLRPPKRIPPNKSRARCRRPGDARPRRGAGPRCMSTPGPKRARGPRGIAPAPSTAIIVPKGSPGGAAEGPAGRGGAGHAPRPPRRGGPSREVAGTRTASGLGLGIGGKGPVAPPGGDAAGPRGPRETVQPGGAPPGRGLLTLSTERGAGEGERSSPGRAYGGRAARQSPVSPARRRRFDPSRRPVARQRTSATMSDVSRARAARAVRIMARPERATRSGNFRAEMLCEASPVVAPMADKKSASFAS